MIVYWQQGYTIDWNWSAELTVWTTSRDRAEQLVATHRLDRIPRSEHEAVGYAQRWWDRAGRAEMATATAGGARPEAAPRS